MPQRGLENKRSWLIASIVLLLGGAVVLGASAGYFLSRGVGAGLVLSLLALLLIPVSSVLLYQKGLLPSYRRLEDANLELQIKQEEMLDIKDDLFIKFLGIYDVNYAANSPRLFANRLKDVADVTARVMEAEACFIFLYEKRKDELELAATNGIQENAIGKVRIALGDGIEGWVGRKLEPIMVKDFHADPRFREVGGLDLGDYASIYCLPLYVYSNGALVGLMEVFYRKPKTFTDEEINFFTTLSGIISTTIQNEQMQVELRKMNLELEQWVAEKTEELRASEERYRTLVENAIESIFVLAENGDIVFANDQAAQLTGHTKYDLVHKNLFDFFVDPRSPREILSEAGEGRRSLKYGALRKTDASVVPVDISAVGLSLMGKRFIQSVVRDISSQARLEKLLAEKEGELTALKARLSSGQ